MSPADPDRTAAHPPAGSSVTTAPPVVVVAGGESAEDPAVLAFVRARLKQLIPLHLFIALMMLAGDLKQPGPERPGRAWLLAACAAAQLPLLALVWTPFTATTGRAVAVWWASVILLHVGIGYCQFDSVRRPEITDAVFAPGLNDRLGVTYANGWLLP